MKWLKIIDSWIARIETGLLVFISIIMVLGAFLQVILRNFFDTGIDGAEILLRHLVLWIGFIGASLATREEKHINVDLFSRIVSPSHKRIAKIITDLIAVGVTLLLTYASWEFVMSEKEFGTTLFSNVKAWPFEIIIPIGFLMISLRFFFNLCLYLFQKNSLDAK